MLEPETTRHRQRLRDAFRKPTYVPVRVVSDGFDVPEDHYDELRGRIIKASLARKLFDDGVLICASGDGIESEDGILCEKCQHPCCQPRLRVHLAFARLVYVLDLPATSAQNLFAFEDRAESEGARLVDWTVRATVLDRGHWGEVTFERLEDTDS